ncbi:MAG: DUF3106 domain-containing protein [Pedosphaera sp.]|nr:DUF3106 domain-containing protein [Pedosphaera sp.]
MDFALTSAWLVPSVVLRNWRALALWVVGVMLLGHSFGADAPRRLPPFPPPMPPIPKPPVEQFRELLSASPAQQEQLLTNRSPEAQALIRSKLREFATLTPNYRELRLRVAQIQFYLLPLLRQPGTTRTEDLARVPVEVRSLLEDRLKAWDQLPATAQQTLLENKKSLGWFAQIERLPAGDQQRVLRQVPEKDRALVESQLARWQTLPAEVRRRAFADFDNFFRLNATEQARTLRTLSDAERHQMEATLRDFADLEPVHRDRCLRSFKRFADFTPSQRGVFLQNAACWEALTPNEREAWRKLVNTLPPMPPMPPHPGEHTDVAGTNSGGFSPTNGL